MEKLGRIRLEVLVVLTVLAIFASLRCSERPRDDREVIRATVLERFQAIGKRGDVNYFMRIEYEEPGGALVHDEILVNEADAVRFQKAFYVCVVRTLDGYRLIDCGY